MTAYRNARPVDEPPRGARIGFLVGLYVGVAPVSIFGVPFGIPGHVRAILGAILAPLLGAMADHFVHVLRRRGIFPSGDPPLPLFRVVAKDGEREASFGLRAFSVLGKDDLLSIPDEHGVGKVFRVVKTVHGSHRDGAVQPEVVATLHVVADDAPGASSPSSVVDGGEPVDGGRP